MSDHTGNDSQPQSSSNDSNGNLSQMCTDAAVRSTARWLLKVTWHCGTSSCVVTGILFIGCCCATLVIQCRGRAQDNLSLCSQGRPECLSTYNSRGCCIPHLIKYSSLLGPGEEGQVFVHKLLAVLLVPV